jgi:hypothetical protein
MGQEHNEKVFSCLHIIHILHSVLVSASSFIAVLVSNIYLYQYWWQGPPYFV